MKQDNIQPFNRKEYQRLWYIKNKDRVREYNKVWYKKDYALNRNKWLTKSREFVKNNPEKQKQAMHTWYINTKDKLRPIRTEYERNKLKTDPTFKLKCKLRGRLRDALKRYKNHAGASIGKLLGCSYQHAREHIESLFKPGMSWDNHGLWHIDHIKPLASFDLHDSEQLRIACHYTNLQPLWASENMSKGAKITSN